MIENHSKLSKRRQCDLLSIHRSNLYYKPKEETALNLHLMQIIDRQFTATPFYGVPRMTDHINRYYPYKINSKRIARLYKIMEIRALGPNPNTSKADKTAYKFPYLLRGLNIDKSNQVWAADITYIVMKHGYMFLFAIIDLYSRMIINWALSNTMEASWCCYVIEEAILLHGTPSIFNTDQGTQFTSDLYVSLLKENNIQISMDGKGRAIDNIFIERFWRSIKQECIYLYPANGGKQLYDEVEEYMRFYNHERPHESLGYQIPAEVYHGRKVDYYPTKYLTVVV